MTTIKEVIQTFEAWAPPNLAAPDDKIGLQIGNLKTPVKGILVGLDPTSKLINKAKKAKANLIITHHPLFFEPITSLTGITGQLAKLLLENNITLYVAHTNLDVTPGGVNDALAEKVGLKETSVLIPTYLEQLVKLVVFIPQGHLEQVRVAICSAGGGRIGKYDHCTFMSSGIGTFRPQKGANPYIGKQGRTERAGEARLETVVPEHLLPKVIAAMTKAHPYEEVAYDVYPLKNKGRILGFGRYGSLEKATNLRNFAKSVKTKLGPKEISVLGNPNKKIKNVAVFSGSFSMSLDQAVDLGIDVLVAGEVKYAKRLEAQKLGISLIVAGHYETEAVVIPKVVNYLRGKINVKITAK